MNYFSHGYPHVDRPYVLAGTAVPDWLSVADRSVRMRARRVDPFLTDASSVQADVAEGVKRHLDEDQWFHSTRIFLETSSELASEFRTTLQDQHIRSGLLGHIVTEMLMDAVLIERDPSLLDAYYSALEEVDVHEVQAAVNRMAKVETTRLAHFIELFRESQFLRDYPDESRLLFRLNQVMRRIKLNPLPEKTLDVLQFGKELVERRLDELLPNVE